MKGSESRQYTPLSLLKLLYYNATLKEKYSIIRQHVYFIVVEILTNMYLDCCKYVYVFTWRGCDIYMENFLLGTETTSISLNSTAFQSKAVRPVSRLTSLNTGQDLNVHNVEDISRKGMYKPNAFLTNFNSSSFLLGF